MFFSTTSIKKGILVCGVLLTGLISVHPALAQETSRLFYLAQVDSNQDDLFTEDDSTQLFTWDGTQAQLLSTVETGNVLSYAADSHYAAYISQNETNHNLSVIDLVSGQTITQSLTKAPVTEIALKENRVWLITRSDDDKPLAIGYNPMTLAVEAQRAAKLADTSLSLQGDWLFAYNPSGLMNVFALPSLDPVTFGLEDYSLSVPIWSPSQTQFQYLAASSEAPSDLFIALVDVAAGESRRLDVPDAPAEALLQSTWSSTGSVLAFQSSIEDDTLRLINIMSGEQTVLREPGYKLAPFIWSDDDRWFVYQASSMIDRSQELILYNMETGQSTLLKNPDIQPVTLSWSPDSSKLAVLGQFGNQGQYGIFVLSAPTFDQWQIQTSSDVSLAEGKFLWLGSDQLALTQNGTLLLLELPTGKLTPLTDKTQHVITNRVSQG